MNKFLSLPKILLGILLVLSLLHIPEADAAKRHKRRAIAVSSPKSAAIIIDASNGNILYQENSDQLRYPASLTKMMTLYLTFEALQNGNLDMNKQLRVSNRAASQAKVNMDFDPGDRITVREAILSVIVKSANDSAVVLAEAVGGSETEFAMRMTSKARKLGMSRTTFQNASGLFNPYQKTTARDLAKMVIALQRDFPQYYPLFSRTSFTYRGRVYLGHNHVTENYRGCDGVKTGFLRVSGFNLASSAVRDGHRVIGVVLGGRTAAARDRRMVQLLDYAFAKMSGRNSRSVAGKRPRRHSSLETVTLPVPADDAGDEADDNRKIIGEGSAY